MSRVAALARLESASILRSRWVVFSAGVYCLLACTFVLIGTRESAVLGFTGIDRVMLSLAHALLLILPLLALSGTALVVNRARDDGTLELLFSHPVTRADYLGAVTLTHFAALLIPVVLVLPLTAVAGVLLFGQAANWHFIVRAVLVSAALLWSFTGIGLAISVRVRDLARATMMVVLVWILAVAVLDFGLLGLMLQWHLPAPAVFALAAINPAEAARLALLSGLDTSLDTLGPVGYFLAQHLNSAGLLAFGVLWPAAAGTMAWYGARGRFRAGDLV